MPKLRYSKQCLINRKQSFVTDNIYEEKSYIIRYMISPLRGSLLPEIRSKLLEDADIYMASHFRVSANNLHNVGLHAIQNIAY